MVEINLPSQSDRTVFIGATGSGKTAGGVWLLRESDWHLRPHFVLDFKGEILFSRLGLTEISLTDDLPREAGIYWIRVLPNTDLEVSEFFRKCYELENCSIFIDEAYMLPYQNKWVRACLTQGRSKNISMITCTQRPVKIDVFFFSEASFMAIFNLRLKKDRDRIAEYTDGLEIKRLPQYHFLWYDVANDEAVIFEPVPPPDKLIADFLSDIEEMQEETPSGERIKIL